MTDPPPSPAGDVPFGTDPLEEHVVGSEVVHRGRYLEVRIETIERADGTRGTRDVVGHPGAVAILALDDDGRLLLVRQWRIPAGRALLEVPAGTLDVHDGVTEDPDVAAPRELEEETGHRATTWRRLASFWTAPGFATEHMHLYLATGIAGAADDDRLTPDEDERLELRHVTLDEALALVDDGDIADAKSILGIQWLDRMRRAGEVPGVPAPPRVAALPGATTEGSASAAPPPPPAAGEGVSIRYGYSPMQFALAYAAFARRQRSMLVFAGLLALGTVLYVLAFQDPIFATVCGLLALASATGWYSVPFAWFQFRNRADVLADLVAVFDERGLTSSHPVGGGTISWSGIERIDTGSGWLFVRSRAGNAVPIPRKAFTADDLRQVEQLALRHGLTLDGHRVDPAPR